MSFLDEKGRPNRVERIHILPPASRIGPISEAERAQVQARSLLQGVYDQAIDRESAYEKLAARAAQSAPTAAPTATSHHAPGTSGTIAGGAGGGLLSDVLLGSNRRDGILTAAAKSVIRSAGSSIGREIVRGILGSLLGGRGRR